MSIDVRCSGCSARYKAAEKLAGKRLKCQKCGAVVEIPALADELEILDDGEPDAFAAKRRKGPSPASTPALSPPGSPAGSLDDFLEQELSAGKALPIAQAVPEAKPTVAAKPLPVAAIPEAPVRPRRARDSYPNPDSPAVTVCTTIGMVLALGLFGLGLVGTIMSGEYGWHTLLGLIFASGGCLMIVAVFIGLGLAFSESTGCGLAAMFVPFFWHYFVLSRWRVAGSAFLLWLTGLGLQIAPVLIVLMIAGHLGVQGRRAAERQAVQSANVPPPPSVFPGSSAPRAGPSVSKPRVETARRFMVDFIPQPRYPELGEAEPLEPGVEFREVRLGVPPTQPGCADTLYVYTPSGRQRPESVGCVLIAAAGGTSFSGARLQVGDRDEHIPYVRQGLVVVAYEVDGALPEGREPTPEEMRQAYRAFSEACAGLVNARNAVEFATTRLPEIDPDHIYTAGHSSAGTLALLYAAHGSRVKGCLAYAPVGDVPKNLGPDLAALGKLLPDSDDFFKRCSPHLHATRITCPVFLFYASDDPVVPPKQQVDFASHLRFAWENAPRDRLTVHVASSGGHYDGMIAEGIPKGIEWLFDEKSGSKPPPVARPPRQWAYEPDAAPPPNEKVGNRAVQLQVEIGDVARILFSSPEAARTVAIGKTFPDGHWLDHYDLETRKRLGRIELPDKSLLADVSPDGTQALLLAAGRAEVWSLDDGDRVTDWRFAPEADRGPGWGCLIGPQRVATLDGQKRLVVWSLPDCQEVYSVDGVSCAAPSPGRKYLAVFTPKDKHHWPGKLIDAADGQLRGSLAELGQRMTVARCAFNRDGSRLAAVDSRNVVVWELRKGEAVAMFEDLGHLWSEQMWFLRSQYVLVDGHLLDTGRKEEVWSYQLGSDRWGWKENKVVGSPDGRVWLAASASAKELPYLAPIRIPGDEETLALANQAGRPGAQPRNSQITYAMLFDGQPIPAAVTATPRGHGRSPASGFPGGRSPSAGRPSPLAGTSVQPLSPIASGGYPAVAGGLTYADTSRQYTRDAHVELIVGDAAKLQERLRWFPGAKRPVIGLRWAFGVPWLGSTAPPRIQSPEDLVGLVGAAGPGLGAALQQRIGDGKFGKWPFPEDARFAQVAFLGVGRQDDLIEEAQRQGLHALVAVSLSSRAVGLTGRSETIMRARLFDVAGKQALWTSKSLNSSEVFKAQLAGDNLVGALVREVLAQIDDNFALKPMPSMQALHVQRRVTSLAENLSRTDQDAMLPVLAELRYYQAEQLLSAADATRLYDQILDEGQGRLLATGDEDQRRAVLEAWLARP
ncbi:MAG: prolyl oligopeptidase family serine peptidase [Pirellulales bacterium]|nr:prolyl oligopeptidase family serine peptidase [Pirellulales bacterium]